MNSVEIDIKYNKLGGTIPKELSMFVSLETLYLKGNYLTGSIPTSLFFATSLTYLNLSVNKLIGTIPEDVVNLKQIIITLRVCYQQLLQACHP